MYEGVIYDAWHKKAAKMFSDYAAKHLKMAERPRYVPADVWNRWVPYWQSEEFYKKSKKSMRNRRKGKEPKTLALGIHVVGSLDYETIKAKLRQELAREPTHYEVFLATHSRTGVDGEQSFVNDRDSFINAEVERMRDLVTSAGEVMKCIAKRLEVWTRKRSYMVFGDAVVESQQNGESVNGAGQPPRAQLDLELQQLKDFVETSQQERAQDLERQQGLEHQIQCIK